MNKLSKLLLCKDSIIVPGVYDALSGKLAELEEFPALWVSGFCVSTSIFVPDENYLSIKQYISRVSEIKRTCTIPLIVDCDEGYGTIKNCLKLFESLSQIKVESCCIEDNSFPKTNSFKNNSKNTASILEKELFADKIYTLKRYFPDMFLIARTESLIVGESLKEAIERAMIYEQAGADLLVIHSKSKNITQFKEIAEAWGNPRKLVVIPTIAEDVTLKELQDIGFKIIICANQVLRGIIQETQRILMQLNSGTTINNLNQNIVSMDYVFSIIEKHYKNNHNV